MSDEPILFDHWRSSASHRVRLALALKGISYVNAPVNLVGNARKLPEPLARNPAAIAPMLEIDGRRLTQSLSIIEYLDETRPAPPLLPAEPAQRARARAFALVIAADIHPLCRPATLDRVAMLGGAPAQRDWARQHYERGLSTCEALLAEGGETRFCAGEAPGLADIFLIPQLHVAARRGVDLSPFPRCRAVEGAFAALPAYHTAHPDRFAPDD